MAQYGYLHGVNRLPATIAIVAVLTLLGACARPQQAEQRTAAQAPAATQDAASAPAASAAEGPTSASPAAGPTLGGDGSEIRLDPLAAADLEDAALSGELACSFSAGDAPPLLYAMGVVGSNDPALGVVKVAGYVERIAAPGGFNGMVSGSTFSGQGKTILIALTGPARSGGESPPRPATLTYHRADGASRTFEGHWQCGP